ncbi:MAG: SPOR domain-containing protein [Erythrobacter sp.]
MIESRLKEPDRQTRERMMNYRKTRAVPCHLVIALALAAGLPATSALADVTAGVEAWEAGNYARAVAEWEAPAKAGDADALYNLAQAYRLGRGVAADSVRAREYYAAASAKGHIKASDNYGLLLFQDGKREQAMPLLLAAAGRGDPRAQYVVGLAYFNGDFVPRDWVRAFALMTLASEAGLPQAAGPLAEMEVYIPLSQRQQGRVLSRQLADDATGYGATPLAAAEGGARPAPAPVVTPVPDRSGAMTGSWRVQLGAFGLAANAERLWNQLADNPALAGTRKVLVSGGKVTRLHAVGFASKAAAEQACSALRRQEQACLVVGDS